MENSLEVEDTIIEEEQTDTDSEESGAKVSVEESILLSIKKLLGILETQEHFDTDVIIHINSAFTNLKQLGVGPVDGYKITSAENKWSEFIQDEDRLESVKTYIYLKVKVIFDPPLNASLMESFKESIRELEWRLNVAVEEN